MPDLILCVEDEEDLRKDIVEELRDAGYEAIEAENGRVALEAIVAQKPDLVLCDVTMPVMDGHALLAEIRENHPDKCELPFVFLSALADRESLMKGRKLGADDYLTKPVDYEMLLAAVESRLQHVQRLAEHRRAQLVRVYKAAAEPGGHAVEAPKQPAGGQVSGNKADGPAAAGGECERSVEQRLHDAVKDGPAKVVAGRVQLLGLDDIKAALGDRWQRHSSIIFDLIEQTIKKRLAPVDVYQRDGNDNFTICFAQLSESEAAFKARAIADEVRTKILGKDFGADAAPLTAEANAFMDEVSGKSSGRPSLEVRGEAHEVELSPDDVRDSGDLLGLLTSRLSASAERASRTERATLIEVAQRARLCLKPVEKQDGSATPFQLAEFDQDTQAKVEALRSLRPASEDLVRDLDVLMVSKVAEEIFRRPPGKGMILIATIHFSTLEVKRRLEHLKTICNTLTEPARAALIFNVVGIPSDLLPAKVAEHFFSIRHFSRAMMAQCEGLALGSIDPVMLRTPVLTFSAWDFGKLLARDPGAVGGFLKQIHRQKLKLLVYGVSDTREVAQLRSLGVDLVCRDR
jgi:CheY-like chemotaxis protein